jgi:hypothetical protein
VLPSIELRIQTLVKALSQVVLPAIDPGNALAREQAQLVIAHLQLIAQQWTKALPYEAQSFAASRALAERLADNAAGGERTRAAAMALRAALAARVDAHDLGSLVGGNLALSSALDVMIEAASVDGAPDFRAVLDRAVLDDSAERAVRERVWFAGTGLDPERSRLPSLDDLLRGASG